MSKPMTRTMPKHMSKQIASDHIFSNPPDFGAGNATHAYFSVILLQRTIWPTRGDYSRSASGLWHGSRHGLRHGLPLGLRHGPRQGGQDDLAHGLNHRLHAAQAPYRTPSTACGMTRTTARRMARRMARHMARRMALSQHCLRSNPSSPRSTARGPTRRTCSTTACGPGSRTACHRAHSILLPGLPHGQPTRPHVRHPLACLTRRSRPGLPGTDRLPGTARLPPWRSRRLPAWHGLLR